MGKITCDDCGTVNDDIMADCELCGASLHEEKEAREEKTQKMLAPIAWGGLALLMTGVFFAQLLWSEAKHKARWDDTPGRRVRGDDLLEIAYFEGNFLLILAAVGGVGLVGYLAYRHYFGDE